MITESNLPSSSSSSSISSSNLTANANGNVNSNNTSNSNNTNNSSNNNINNNNNNNNAVNGNSATSPLQSTNATATATVSSTTTTTAAVPGTSASTQSSSGTFGTDNRWIFPLESVEQTPSRSDGVSSEEELNERQDAALFISDLGALLKVNQLCINTAIIYMHRFYMIHSLKKFNRYVRKSLFTASTHNINMVATACLFLACKVEEQPRRLREFIDAIQNLFHKSASDNYNPEEFRKNGDEIVALESCLLQTLGFSVLVNHAHTVIIKTCQMIKAPRDLAEAAYLTATNSLILTNFCVKFSSEKIACFCIYLACKWTGLMIPVSSEGLQWYQYVRHDIQEQELEDISKEYLTIYDKCLPKIQKKLGKTKSCDPTISSTNQTSNHQSHHPAAQKYHHQQQQAHGHGPAHHNPHQVHPNIKKSSHHLIDNQTHASNVNIKQQPSHPANVAGKPSLPGSHASHNYPHASQQPQPQPQHSQHHHQMQQPKHNNLPYPQHHQSQPANHPHHPPPTQHLQQQQQQQRPSQNLNKSLNLPTSNTSNQIKQPIKHPSSSHLTSNKSNGSQILNQNGATQAQSNLNIKTEKHIQHHQTNNNNNNHHPHHINNNNNNNNNHHHQNLDNHSVENNNLNSASKNLVTNKNPSNAVNNTKPVNSVNIKSEPGIQASTSSSSTPPATSSGASGSSSMKRGNEDLTSAPNKIPKYIIDQKSAS